MQRAALIGMIFLGLMVGMCGGLEQVMVGSAIYLVHEASENNDNPKISPQLTKARETLDTCYNMTTALMYLGIAIILAASLGLHLQSKRAPSGSHE